MVRLKACRSVMALTILIGLISILACSSQQSDRPNPADRKGSATEQPAHDSLTITLVGQDSVSAFELLTKSHRVDFWSTAAGVFVNGIDSIRNGSQVFWVYSVNDSTPDIASDRKITKAGDKVVWHFRKLK